MNYGNEIFLHEIHQFPNRVLLKQFVTILLPKTCIIGKNIFTPPSLCRFAYKVQPMCKYCKMPKAYDCEALMIRDLEG
jgi:hypothetical protein